MFAIVIIGTLALIGITMIVLRYAKLPAWSHRDVLAFLALMATIGGAVMLTMVKVAQNNVFVRQADRLINELVRDSTVRTEVGEVLKTIIDAQSWNLKMDSVAVTVVLLSLGLVISARTIKGKIFGNELEFTNNEQKARAEGAAATADAATNKAEQIAEGAEPVSSDSGLPEGIR